MNSAAETGAARGHSAPDARPIKLACRNVWKLFGADAAGFIRERNGKASSRRSSPRPGWSAPCAPSISKSARARSSSSWACRAPASRRWCAACRGWSSRPTARSSSRARTCCKSRDAELIELRRHRMGMVFQHFALLPHLTVLENVAFPLSIQGIDRPSARGARARGDRARRPARPRAFLSARAVRRPAAARRHRPQPRRRSRRSGSSTSRSRRSTR